MVLVTESYGDRSFIAWATKQWQSHLEWWRSQGITIEVKRWITGSILAEKSLKLQLDGLTCRREVWSGDCIWVLNLCLNVYVLVKVIEMGDTTWCIYSTGTTIVCVCVCVCVSHSVVSNSLQPHDLCPTRLLCPWDSPGKNTGVDYISLLQGIFLTQGLNKKYVWLKLRNMLI